MIAAVAAATGWTFDYVEDQVTVPRLRALLQVWEQSPPPPLLLKFIAARLGWR